MADAAALHLLQSQVADLNNRLTASDQRMASMQDAARQLSQQLQTHETLHDPYINIIDAMQTHVQTMASSIETHSTMIGGPELVAANN